MKIVAIGTRGIPRIQGGVETHCEKLYPRLAAMGNDVTVIRRKPYVSADNTATEYQGVHLVDLYAPHKKSFEAIVHTALAVLRARKMKPDVLHIHAIGPNLLTPIARLLGMKVVMTHHGTDYNRGKWGRMAKTILRMGERAGVRHANAVISISQYLSDFMANEYGRTDTYLIPNGVEQPTPSAQTDYVAQLGLTPKKYIVALGRFVPEKGFHDLIEAYKQLDTDCRLVIAGDADHPDAYSEDLKQKAADAGVVLTGFIRGEKLNQLMTNALLFAMPSYHEGLPIALLEAMSYNLDVAVSDIPANRLPELDAADFFPAGNIEKLTELLASKLNTNRQSRHYDLSNYQWDSIAKQTLNVYHNI